MFIKTEIEKYFLAQKQESLILCLAGIIAILLAGGFFFLWKTQFAKGAAAPLLALGILQAIIGYAVYAKSDKQRIDNVYAADMNPGKLKNQELPRIHSLNRNLTIYRFVELFLILAGIGMGVYFKSQPDRSFYIGLGVALAIESALLLGLDSLAWKRALFYTSQLETFLGK